MARQRSARERRLLSAAVVVGVVVGMSVIATRAAMLAPLAQTQPIAIAQEIAKSPTPMRVLNDYNSSGPLIAFSGGRARLAVDGRADFWGSAAIERVRAVGSLGEGWRTTMTAFRPEALVIRTDGPLDELLQITPSGWYRAIVDHDYVLWLRDASSSQPLVPQASGP